MSVFERPKNPAPADDQYERDFYSWAFRQAALLREGRFDELDIANVAEELETLGRMEFNSLVSALRVLTMHLLKWDHQPDRRSRSWALTIAGQREDLADVLKDNPGLKPRFGEALARAYRRARLEAANETGLDLEVFSASCPYDLAAITTREIAWER
jgi:hypothetical protein